MNSLPPLLPADVVQIDGQVVDTSGLGGDHALNPGEHTVIVHRDGNERARVLFALSERERRDISLPLPGPAAGLQPRSTSLDTPASPHSTDLTDRSGTRPGRRWWASPWTWIAAGAVVAGASVTAFALYGSRNDGFSGNVPPGQISVH